jgi:hypothetical protein
MDESAIEGHETPNVSTGESVWRSSRFADLWETPGAVYCLDELDRANPAVLPMLNNALADSGRFNCVPAARCLVRADGHVLIGCGNTPLRGATAKYNTAEAQDGASTDRFTGAFIHVDYDTDLERRICADGFGVTGGALDVLLRMRDVARTVVSDNSMDEDWGTRAVVASARWTRAGKDPRAVVSKIVAGWSESDSGLGGLGAGARGGALMTTAAEPVSRPRKDPRDVFGQVRRVWYSDSRGRSVLASKARTQGPRRHVPEVWRARHDRSHDRRSEALPRRAAKANVEPAREPLADRRGAQVQHRAGAVPGRSRPAAPPGFGLPGAECVARTIAQAQCSRAGSHSARL